MVAARAATGQADRSRAVRIALASSENLQERLGGMTMTDRRLREALRLALEILEGRG